MTNDVATKAMPDFRSPAFLDTMSFLSDTNLDLASVYLMSITALTLGMDCEVVRSVRGPNDQPLKPNEALPLPTLYKVTSGDQSAFFNGSIARSGLSKKMAETTKSKIHTKRALADAGINSPFGGMAWDENLTVLDGLADAGVQRVLLKPNKGSRGRGILADVSVDDARAHVIANPGEAFVVEQYIDGTEYRIYTVGGEFCTCYAKIRDNVVGDGKSTLRDLIARKLAVQLSNPDSREKAKRNMDKAQVVANAGHDLAAVPEKGKFVWLNDDYIPRSRDGVYLPSGVNDSIKKLAKNVATAVGANICAIDLINSPKSGPYILEINAKPGISPASFPQNAAWNLHLPETILRHTFPDHQDKVRRIKVFRFARLIKDFRTQPLIQTFDVKDYVKFL